MSSSPETQAGHPRAVILGCAGTRLTPDERRFFEEANPLGFILFRRNIETPEQVRGLIGDLRSCVRRVGGLDRAPVLIDQEGGRVARLGSPHWPTLPPARAVGILAERDRAAGLAAARAAGRVIGAMLADLGIDVVCAPVADLLLPGTDGVIGDRAYSADPGLTGALAGAACAGFLEAGVTPIVKHSPGHGRATADSHFDLPRIEASREQLESSDFAAFRAVRDAPWAMVAHCVYAAIDPDRPASVSRDVISGVIRGSIGFDGVLIADDIGMKALRGSLADSAAKTLAAGCDVTLHCSGDRAEMTAIMPSVSPLGAPAAERLARAAARARDSHCAFDLAAAFALLTRLLPS